MAVFLTAAWQDLVMLSCEVDPEALVPWLRMDRCARRGVPLDYRVVQRGEWIGQAP